jgi:HK97 family phage prohead protease
MYLSPVEFKSLAKKNELAKLSHIRKEAIAAPSDTGDRQLTFTISTSAVDRDNDSVNQTGWQLENYKLNPVVLFSHDTSSLPVAKCTQIGIQDGNLTAVVEFIPLEIPVAGPMAEAVYQLCLKGFMSACSVGFRPLKWEFSDDPARGADSYNGGCDFISQELMEFSICPVPANPQALIITPSQPVISTPVPVESEKLNNSYSDKIRLQMKTRILEL